MLTESFYVRRVRKFEDAATKEPRVASDEQGEVGVARFAALVPVPDASSPTGHRMEAVLGVCWEKTNYPAISFENPADVEHLDDTLKDVVERLDEDYGDGFLVEVLLRLRDIHGIPKVLEAIQQLHEEEGDEDEDEDEGDQGDTQESAPAAAAN